LVKDLKKESAKNAQPVLTLNAGDALQGTMYYTIYKGKLIILTDRRCASACEDFVVPFKDNHRAIIIGEETAGSTGQPYIYRFNKDIFIRIGTKRVYMPDGSPFEGKGILPDIKIQPTIKDIKIGRDVILKKAIVVADLN